MANYQTCSDLIKDVLFRANEPTDASSDYYDAAIKYLNRAYQAMWRGGSELCADVSEEWFWLKKPGGGTLTLLPTYTSGTVNASNNNQFITYSAAPTLSGVNISVQGYHIRFSGCQDVFKIVSHTAGAVLATLDSPFTGGAVAPADFTHTTFKIDYTLATDVLYLCDPMRGYQAQGSDNQIGAIHESIMRTTWPIETCTIGLPQNFAILSYDSGTHTQLVRFSHCGGNTDTKLMRVDYEYLYRPSDIADDATEVACPREYRRVICDWALYYLLKDKEDTRAEQVLQGAAAGLRHMASEHKRMVSRPSSSIGRIYARQAIRKNVIRGPLRTESGYIITL